MTADWTTHVMGMSFVASAPPVAGREGGGQATEGQADGQQPLGPGGQQGPPPSPFGGGFIWILLAFLVFMILTSVLGGRKEKKKRAQMLSSLRKHDRVQTTGGIIGTISEIRDDEVLLKVDEHTNTRIRVARFAIQQVLRPSPSRDEGSEMPEPEKIEA